MSRTNRINKMIKTSEKHINSGLIDNKTDYAIRFAKAIAESPNNKRIEENLTSFVMKSRHILVTSRNYDKLRSDNVEFAELGMGAHSEPLVKVKCNNEFYYFTVADPYGIYLCNEYLRSLNLNVDISFKNYNQYGMLLWRITELLKEKRFLTFKVSKS